jgi:ketosteroid isomerase-like protein
MDAQATMRLMFDTMDAYDRGDFDRLAEIYAEDASWINADPEGPHCHNREDIFDMFRARMGSGTRITFDELRSTPTQVVVTARASDFGRVVGVHLRGAPNRGDTGLPLDGGCRIGTGAGVEQPSGR